MSKYIIELDDRIKLVTSVGVTENGVVYTTSDYVHNLEELNSDYINEHYGSLQDEAYQRGINDGSLDVKQRVEGAYQRGLEDAWEVARKIMCDDGIDMNTLCTIFRRGCSDSIIRDYSASEAIAKLKVYEDKHSDRIEVGDEVRTRDGAPSHTFLVTKVTDSHVYGISNDGSWNYWTKDEVTKTGKHYDIQSILEAMRK